VSAADHEPLPALSAALVAAGADFTNWTAADQAELDVLVWTLVDAYFEHRGRCEACDPEPCPSLEAWYEHKADCLICDGSNHPRWRRHAPLTH
jgi:hypothetical protein